MLRLDRTALDVLARISLVVELAGHWHQDLDPILIVLLPKGEGGFRPIGLFPTIIQQMSAKGTFLWRLRCFVPKDSPIWAGIDELFLSRCFFRVDQDDSVLP